MGGLWLLASSLLSVLVGLDLSILETDDVLRVSSDIRLVCYHD